MVPAVGFSGVRIMAILTPRAQEAMPTMPSEQMLNLYGVIVYESD